MQVQSLTGSTEPAFATQDSPAQGNIPEAATVTATPPPPPAVAAPAVRRTTFAAAANAIRFSNALRKKATAVEVVASEQRPLQRYPSQDKLPVTRGASVSQLHDDDGISSSTGRSFESPDATHGKWENALQQYGGMAPYGASQCAGLIVSAGLPAPSPAACRFITHDVLRTIGIEAPGDRARILLAVHRMPLATATVTDPENGDPEQETVSAMFRSSRAAGHAKALGRVSKTYSIDRTRVHVTTTKRGDKFGAMWHDIAGNDSDLDADVRGAKYDIAVRNLMKAFTAPTTPSSWPARRPDSSLSRSDRPSAALHTIPDTEGDGLPLLTVENSTGGLKDPTVPAKYANTPSEHTLQPDNASNHSSSRGGLVSVASIWDVLFRGKHLPTAVLVEHDAPHRVAFTIRVCRTPDRAENGDMVQGVDTKDVSTAWHVVVDTELRVVASLHDIDSFALATLRDHDAAPGETFALADAVAGIVSAVLIEIEVVLDECTEVLDECETLVLKYDQHTRLIRELFQLERRSAVYARIIDANQAVVAEAGRALAISADFASLDAMWHRLRTKSTNICTRSRRQLTLVLDLSGHRTNSLMSALTKPSVVFIPITFVTGLYGMRFENMPELHYENSYYVLWGLFILSMIVGLLLTRKL